MRNSGVVAYSHCGAKIMLVTCCDSFTPCGCTWAVWPKAEVADVTGTARKARMTSTTRRAAEMPATGPGPPGTTGGPSYRGAARGAARPGRSRAHVQPSVGAEGQQHELLGQGRLGHGREALRHAR